jgi:hypothetical protein
MKINETSDGISKEEWAHVYSICSEILSAVESEDEGEEQVKRIKLFGFLDGLQKKYGELPSILATKADYASDDNVKVALLQKAFEIAKTKRDDSNLTLISSSLAQAYIEDLKDKVQGKKWLNELKSCLAKKMDRGEADEYDRLSKILHGA